MAYTARQLISRSWYLSGIVARGLQTVSGDQITDGLFLLNALLNWKSVQVDLIPYFTYYEFPAVVNQEEYYIENLYQVESLTFNKQTVRYSTQRTGRTAYFGSSRVDDIESLPFNWTFNRKLDGGTIYLYFKPDEAYPIKIMGKFGLTNVTLDTDMLLTYDASYIEYLRYCLAQYMCSEYGITFNPESAQILKGLEHELMYVSPPDLALTKTSILTKGAGLNWADINLGRGWRP